MKAIIVSAGYGSRLEEHTKERPKGLLDINGKTILERQISLFKKNGINDIVVITGPYKNFGMKDVSYINDEDYDKHDVLGSLMAAKDDIIGDVLTSYSDILFDESILHQLLEFRGDIGIPIDLDWKKSYEGRTQHPKSEADNVLLKNNKIIQIQKNIPDSEKGEIVGEFLGPIILSAKGAKIFVENYERLEKEHQGPFHMAPSLKKAYLTDMIQELIDLNYQVTPIIISGKWCEIDTSEDLERARKLFL